MSVCAGIYRGVVEDLNDPERRKRMRVRVYNLHPQEVPTQNLPWAELSLAGSRFVGDIPTFRVNDPVFVAFEGGDRRYPVVLGGHFSFAGGVPDVPGEVHADYARTQKRWVRIDDAGNKIVMSPLPEERWIHLQAGNAALFLRQNDGAVEIITSGPTRIAAPVVEVNAEGGEITAVSKTLFAEISSDGAVKAGKTIALRANDKIQVGAYTDSLLIPYTTDVVEIDADNNIKISSRGTLDVDASQDITIDTPEDVLVDANKTVIIDGASTVELRSAGDVKVDCDGKCFVDCEGNAEIDSAAQVIVKSINSITVEAGSSMKIDVKGGNLDLTVTGACNLTSTGACTIKSTGSMTLDSAAVLTLKAASKVTMTAPLVEVVGTAQAVVDAGAGVTSIKGSLINIG